MSAETIARGLDPNTKRQKGGHWLASCPCHADGHPSLWLKDIGDGARWKCLSGCRKEDVTAELLKRGLIGKKANGAGGEPGTRKARKPADQAESWRPVLPVPEGAPEPALSHPTHGQPSAVWTYRDVACRTLFHVCRFDPPGERKQVLPRVWGALDGKTGWFWRHPPEPRPLYGLDRLAARPEAPVVVVEGEKAADAAAGLLTEHIVVTWPGGAAVTGKVDWAPLAGRHVCLWPDNDEPGRRAAEAIGDVLLNLAAEVRVVDVPADLPEGWDLADPLPDGLDLGELLERAEPHLPAVERLVERAAGDPGAPFEAGAIDFLAALRDRDPPAYERARARLKTAGIRVAALDQALERRAPAAEGTNGQGRALELQAVEPWPDPVAGDALLTAMLASLRQFVVLPEAAAIGTVLWALHCHAHEAAFCSPRLAITSPVMRCGKSSLLRWLARVVPRPLPTSNISAAAVFRVIEAAYPTLLIDELDQVDPDKRVELVGVINSSHCRVDAQIVRTVGDQHEPRVFSTWAPMALAAIGKLPATWVDRSIVVEMTRKLASDCAETMRLDRDQGFEALRRKAARWAQDHLDLMRDADPAIPIGLNDRQADNWRLLLAMADRAGGEWPAGARAAAVELSTADDDGEARGVQLLADVRAIFEARGDPDQLPSETIVSALVEMEGRPWAEYRRDGKPLTKNALARLLKAFGIAPNTVRVGAATPKGYQRAAFAVAWARYLQEERSQTATPPQATESARHSVFQTATADRDVPVANRPKPSVAAGCGGVADGIPDSWAEDDEGELI